MSKEKIKKPFYKKWWVWLLAVIIIIALVNGGGGEDSTKKDKATTTSTTTSTDSTKNDTAKKETNKEEKPKKEEKKAFGIGDNVNVGKMAYKINKVSTASQVGPSALPKKASGKFVVIDVTLKNGGNDAVTVDASFFTLKLGDKTYKADSEASMSANQGEDGSIDNSFFLQDLNPDSTIEGKVVFDVAPEVASAKDLTLQVQTGVFGTETEVINLK